MELLAIAFLNKPHLRPDPSRRQETLGRGRNFSFAVRDKKSKNNYTPEELTSSIGVAKVGKTPDIS